jgi:hypothetical protein
VKKHLKNKLKYERFIFGSCTHVLGKNIMAFTSCLQDRERERERENLGTWDKTQL